jgi:hypothetical protein
MTTQANTGLDTAAASEAPRGRELWPLLVVLALLLMIGVCGAFYAVATAYPDPPVDVGRAGLRPYQGYVPAPAPDAGAAR